MKQLPIRVHVRVHVSESRDHKFVNKCYWDCSRGRYRSPRLVKTKLTRAVERAIRKGEKFITGYKKVYVLGAAFDVEEGIATLEIPVRAAMRSPHDSKCRASRAKVVHIKALASRQIKDTAFSLRDRDFLYVVGEVVKPNLRFDYHNVVCSSGIHFYLTYEEAVNH